MSEEKRKQYILMVDDLHLALLGKLMPGLMYAQLEGLAMEGNPNYTLMVNPVQKPDPCSESTQ